MVVHKTPQVAGKFLLFLMAINVFRFFDLGSWQCLVGYTIDRSGDVGKALKKIYGISLSIFSFIKASRNARKHKVNEGGGHI